MNLRFFSLLRRCQTTGGGYFWPKQWLLVVFLLSVGFSVLGQNGLSVDTFRNPDSRYGINCFWWWLNGHTDKETITRDLEDMRAKKFRGALLVDAGGANALGNNPIPDGPLFGSPEWRELYAHAVREADRLGLEISLNIMSGWDLGAPDTQPFEAAKQVTYAETTVSGPGKVTWKLPIPESRFGFYRDIAVLAYPVRQLPNRPPIQNLETKMAAREAGGSAPDTRFLLTDIPGTPGEEDAVLSQVINLSNQVKNGTLEWEAPAGNWVVLRMGYTPTKAQITSSSGKWLGHVIDYMSETHLKRYWTTHVEPLIQLVGPLAGKALKYIHTDSFEAGGMNWTDGFEGEFRQRRGYDLSPYLPVLAGKIIENRAASNQFLNDFRKTIGELVAEKHYGTLYTLSAAHGLALHPESAGPHAGPFDGLKNYGYSQIMMSEFWSPSPHRPRPFQRFFVKQAASAAKIYGKQLVGAESFTTQGPHWNDVIWADMKPSVDHEFCAGLNYLFLHKYTSSPQKMGLPGQEYAAGTHFNPNVTWWSYANPFIQYLMRCQYLLQQGRSQADVLYYYGDHVPNIGRFKEDDPAQILPGYDYDLIHEDRLLMLQYENGKIRLLNGAAYSLLVLPNHGQLSAKALLKVQELVERGATVFGPKPLGSGSLMPVKSNQFQRTANRMWGEKPGEAGQQKIGKGWVIWGKSPRPVLQRLGLVPDFEVISAPDSAVYDYSHRVDGNTDLYFISSQNRQATRAELAFRMAGKQPESWDPLTGTVTPLRAFTQRDGRTIIPLELAPYGSLFIVFRTDSPKSGAKKANFPVYEPLLTLNTPWEVRFDPKWGGPATTTFDRLIDWTDHAMPGIKYYSGKAVYRTTFEVPPGAHPTDSLVLELGDVRDVGIARVFVNDRDLGIVWTPPFRVGLEGLKPGQNQLTVEVVNTWRNRLIGDRELPENERFTRTNIRVWKTGDRVPTKQESWQSLPPTHYAYRPWQLTSSGLLGPVRILRAKEDGR